jgi:cellulose synthase (UDP-forming)
VVTGEKLSIISLSRRTVYAVVAVLSLVVYVLLAAVPTDLLTQVLLVLAIYTGLIVVNQWRHLNFGKLVYIALLTLLSLRYFIWRTFETLGYQDPVSFVFMMLLYTAEIFGFLLFAFGLFVNIAPLNREEEWVEPDKDDLPSVDVYIPTYNEAPELVAITVAAAAQIDYPSDKLNVYVLDDGGTKAKTTQSDPDARESAIARQKLIQNVCDQFEANYITREKNEQAKAGNFNSAFPKTNGDLILTLDADHVPTSDILMRTVGYFQKRDDLFLVQTPHFMINADPIERNLDTFRRMPSENEMFYRSIQRGLDFWDASFFCGSAAILRRKALEETNGLCTETITEDAETALTLHARGWHSVYVARPMVAGLAPETFSGLAVQRTRWAQGMVQILMLKSPLLMPNLTWAQRIGYLSSCLYWLFPIARFVFLLAPLAFLFFGLKIYNVTGPEFLVYTLPHFVGSMIYATFMFGKVRWPFIGVVYEIMQSLYALPSILRTFWRPRSPHFNVTPKGETLERDFVSPLSTPFYAVFCLVALAFVFAGYRWVHYPPQREVIAVISIWNTMNFISLLMALGTLMERRQLRLNPRIPADVLAKLQLGSIEIPGRLTDLSMGGTRFVPDLKTALPDLEGEKSGTLHIPAREGSREQELSVTRTPDFSGKAFSGGIGLTFKAVSSDDFAKIVTLVHGDSQRWDDYWKRNEGETRVGSALMFLFRAGIVNSFRHAAMLINAGWQNLKLRSRSLPEGRHKRASEASRL